MARPWRSSRLSCGERLFLRCDGIDGNSFLNTQGMDSSSRSRRGKRGSSGCGRDSRASFRVESGMSGYFSSCSKGVKDPLEVPEFRCHYPRDASAEMGLISPGGKTYWIFSSCGRCSRLTTGTSGTCSGGLRKGHYPCELHRGLSGFLSRRCRGGRPFASSVPEPEDSSPMLT